MKRMYDNEYIDSLEQRIKVLEQVSPAVEGIRIVKYTDSSITLGQVAAQLNEINTAGDHVLFDVSALGASMYLCTIFIDTTNNVYRIFDMVVNRISEGVYNASTLLTMAIANADTIAKQSQIDSLQTQINELGGHKVIEDWDMLGDLIESGDSTDYINAGDTIDVNWVNTVLGTITSGATVTCSDKQAFTTSLGKAEAGSYLFVFNGTNWTYNEEVIDLNDWGLTITGTPVTGDVMTIAVTVTTRNYTFVGYDDIETVENATHNWILEQTYAPDTKAYDSLEALFNLKANETLAAGNYKITSNYQAGATPYTLYFTLAEAVSAPADKPVQFAATSINWTSPCYPTTLRGFTYGTNTAVTATMSLSTTEISGATDLTNDARINRHDSLIQCDLGNNCWPRSNIRSWLNDATEGSGYLPTYDFDRPSAYNLASGFLYCIDPRVLALILTSQVKWTAGYDNTIYTQGTTYVSNDKVFLLSMKEMSFNINTNEGNATDLYSSYCNGSLTNDAVANRSKYNYSGGTKNNYRWSRSAFTSSARYSMRVLSAGTNGYNNAISSHYFAPAFAIGKTTE